ncbi:MAG: glycosyltransferase [Phycisphaerales bacterium JB039]
MPRMLDADESDPARRPRIALAHDWLCGMRGGEMTLARIARAAAEIGDISALYLMFDDRRPHDALLDKLPKRRSWLNGLPGALRLRRWLLPLYPAAAADLSKQLAHDHAQQPIDLLISSSSAAVKGMRAPGGVPHLCYCHSPARYVWSRAADYGGGGIGGRLRSLGLGLAGPLYRGWDRRSARNVTRFIANSSHIAGEIDRCYRREAVVIHPPVRTDFFTPDPAVRRERFWLVVSALEPYKRTDVAIEAANLAGRRLVIVGDGSCRRELARRAGPLVRFEGRVADQRLRHLYRTAAVLLFPQIEDFGIVCAEAQACGLPVAAAGAGGALDMIVEGATGALATPGDARSLADAGRRAAQMASAACAENALRFSEERFDAEITGAIEAALADHQEQPAAN